MSSFRTSRTFDALFLLCLLVVLVAAYIYRVVIGDWVFFQTHKPSDRVIALAKTAELTESGTKLLYRGDPQFASASTVDSVCETEKLGCLTSKGQIYILDDPTNPDQSVITALHEMLHLAYRRLSESDKAGLSYDLTQIQQKGDLETELKDYTDSQERLDETFAIAGTEISSLPQTLETHYQKYFQDRTEITSIFQASLK